MADRTSAEIFGNLFKFAAKNPKLNQESLKKYLWKAIRDYDFHPCQMDCSEALAQLGFDVDKE